MKPRIGRKQWPGFGKSPTRDRCASACTTFCKPASQALNQVTLELGRGLAEFILYAEHEERAGPDYQLRREGLCQWASEPGSGLIAGQKVAVERPRLRCGDKEVSLQSYQAMRAPEAFSEQLLAQSLAGLSARRYRETVLARMFHT